MADSAVAVERCLVDGFYAAAMSGAMRKEDFTAEGAARVALAALSAAGVLLVSPDGTPYVTLLKALEDCGHATGSALYLADVAVEALLGPGFYFVREGEGILDGRVIRCRAIDGGGE